MKSIIVLSDNKVWSLGNKKGAPSFYNTLKLYNDAGYDVCLIQPDSVVENDLGLQNLRCISFKHSAFEKKIYIKKLGYFVRIFVGLYNKRNYIRTAQNEIKKGNTVLLYAYEYNGVTAAKYLHRKFGIPFITRFQGTILGGVELNTFNRFRYYPHVKAIGTKSDLCIMTNDGTKGDIVLNQLGNNSPRLFLKNGVDISAVDYNLCDELKNKYNPEGRVVLMTLSRLVQWKRIDRAICILEELLKYNQNIELIIVGAGADEDRLKKMVSTKKLEQNVLFIGEIEKSQVANYLSVADIFLSLYDLSNVGNPLLEAMMNGKMIVTLNVGTTNEIIKNGENGLIYDLKDIGKIPYDLLAFINDKMRIKELGEAAKKYAQENFYSWDRRMQMELSEVEKLLSKNS